MDNYSIIDLEGYAKSLREGAAKSFSETYSEDLDEFISIDQVIELIKQNSLGQDDDDNYLVDEDTSNKIFDDIRSWIYDVGLSKLASKGYVECAWDDESNEMIFWLANQDQSAITEKSSKNDNE